jgi:hypothetical protein
VVGLYYSMVTGIWALPQHLMLGDDDLLKGGWVMKSNMKSNSVFFGSLVASILASVTILAPFPAQSEEAAYQYVVPRGEGGDTVYQLHKKTGAIRASRFGTNEILDPSKGCPEGPGDFSIAAIEGGISRSDAKTGNECWCKLVAGSICCCPGTKLCDASRACH